MLLFVPLPDDVSSTIFSPNEGIFYNKQIEILPSKTTSTICILNVKLMEIELARVS
jgi:hypothetical protein